MQYVNRERTTPQIIRLLLVVSVSLVIIMLALILAPFGQVASNSLGIAQNTYSQCNSSGNPTSVQTGRYLTLIADSEVNSNPWTSVAELNGLDGDGNLIDQQNLSISAVNSEEPLAQDGRATNAIDGDPSTFWHTEWSRNEPVHPHLLTLGLSASYKLCALRYLPRQGDADSAQNGRIAQYRIYLSLDNPPRVIEL